MIIKKGFDNKPLELKLSYSDRETPGSSYPTSNRLAELWIEFDAACVKGSPFDHNKLKETLSYISITELLDLRDNINSVISEMMQ